MKYQSEVDNEAGLDHLSAVALLAFVAPDERPGGKPQ